MENRPFRFVVPHKQQRTSWGTERNETKPKTVIWDNAVCWVCVRSEMDVELQKFDNKILLKDFQGGILVQLSIHCACIVCLLPTVRYSVDCEGWSCCVCFYFVNHKRKTENDYFEWIFCISKRIINIIIRLYIYFSCFYF